ncbi:MAG: hypothetical protein ABI651_17840 [Verrucomicrobiota bacterium]
MSNASARLSSDPFLSVNAGIHIPDIGSGLKEWARYDADMFAQLTDFTSERSTTNGFT